MGHLMDGGVPGAAYDGCLAILEEGSALDRSERGAGRCRHGCYPVEVRPVEGGRSARCLGCGQSGPARPSAAGALAALRDEARRSLREAG